MKLSEMLDAIEVLSVSGSSDVAVEGVTYDSRKVNPGWLFVAVRGGRANGADYIIEAVSKGASVVVSEELLEVGSVVTHVHVPHARRALAELSAVFYGNISHRMQVIGVTGTNGKTTTACMIHHLLNHGGFRSGLLGTVGYEIGDRSLPAARTTPEAPDIHSFFHQMKSAGCDSAVMEVSSHALAQYRVHKIDFNIAVFTNLTQDHLDYHNDMESYFIAKARLFEMLEKHHEQYAVINVDDPWGHRLIEEHRLSSEVLTYGFSEKAAIRATDASMDVKGTSFHVSTPWGDGRMHLRLLGRFNIYNALAALAVGGIRGIGLKEMGAVLSSMDCVPGRLERVSNKKNRQVFVDYAHTEDALKNVLTTLREICRGRLIAVFGCGGNRDREKREKMGRVAEQLADYSVLTSDNPRDEDPAAVLSAIVRGFENRDRFEVVLDRREAIARALQLIDKKDILLIAGKGHETYQEIRGTIVPFDDREVVKEIIG